MPKEKKQNENLPIEPDEIEFIDNALTKKVDSIIHSDVSNEEKTDAIVQALKKEYIHSVDMVEAFLGPLPPPSVMGGYEDVLPGSAERIIKLTESEVDHRHKMDERRLSIVSRDSLLGIILSFVLTLITLVIGLLTILKVPGTAGTVAGLIFGVSGIGGIIITMIQSTRYKNKGKPK